MDEDPIDPLHAVEQLAEHGNRTIRSHDQLAHRTVKWVLTIRAHESIAPFHPVAQDNAVDEAHHLAMNDGSAHPGATTEFSK